MIIFNVQLTIDGIAHLTNRDKELVRYRCPSPSLAYHCDVAVRFQSSDNTEAFRIRGIRCL